MASRRTGPASRDAGPDRDEAGSGEGPGELAAPGIPSGLELSLADLICDEKGEVVIFNDSDFRTLALTADVGVLAKGRSGRHVTAGGDDVTGFHYVRFENGVMLYYPEGVDLILHGPARSLAP